MRNRNHSSSPATAAAEKARQLFFEQLGFGTVVADRLKRERETINVSGWVGGWVGGRRGLHLISSHTDTTTERPGPRGRGLRGVGAVLVFFSRWWWWR